MLSFVGSVGRSDGLRLLCYQLDWIPSCPVLPLAYIPSLDGALLPWLAVSLGESLLFSDSKHAILVRMSNRHDHHLRSRSVSSWSFVSFLPSFLPASVRWYVGVVRELRRSVALQDENVLDRRGTIRRLYASYRHQYRSRTSRPPSSRITATPPVSGPISPARCAAEIISTAVFTEPDSACLMLELRVAEIGKFNDAAALYYRHAGISAPMISSERNIVYPSTRTSPIPRIKRPIARVRNCSPPRPLLPRFCNASNDSSEPINYAVPRTITDRVLRCSGR